MPDYSRVYIPNSLKQYVYICQNDTYTLALYVYILRCYNTSDNFISDNYGETIGGNYAK